MVAQKIHKEKGAASIFVVAFFMLLISVITVSFVNIVIQDQKQSLNSDLSQSAYDSASAGVEDAQRVLRWYSKNCTFQPRAATDEADCVKLETGDRCNLQKLSAGLTAAALKGTKYDNNEVKISQNVDDDDLDQAYSCVSIQTQTDNYIATLSDGKSNMLVPLKTVNNESFNTIDLRWYLVGDNDDVAKGSLAVPTINDSSQAKLPLSNADSRAGNKWGNNRPPIIRFEIIPVKRGDINIESINTDTRTLFLYPSTDGDTILSVLGSDGGRGFAKLLTPQRVKCNNAADNGEYACNLTLNDLNYSLGGDASNTDFYVRITPLYSNATVQLKLYDVAGGVSVPTLRKFDNVSPMVDSTGRANDVYRRVQTRVIKEIPKNPTADGGFDVAQGLCKDFQVPNYTERPPTDCLPSNPNLVY